MEAIKIYTASAVCDHRPPHQGYAAIISRNGILITAAAGRNDFQDNGPTSDEPPETAAARQAMTLLRRMEELNQIPIIIYPSTRAATEETSRAIATENTEVVEPSRRWNNELAKSAQRMAKMQLHETREYQPSRQDNSNDEPMPGGRCHPWQESSLPEEPKEGEISDWARRNNHAVTANECQPKGNTPRSQARILGARLLATGARYRQDITEEVNAVQIIRHADHEVVIMRDASVLGFPDRDQERPFVLDCAGKCAKIGPGKNDNEPHCQDCGQMYETMQGGHRKTDQDTLRKIAAVASQTPLPGEPSNSTTDRKTVCLLAAREAAQRHDYRMGTLLIGTIARGQIRNALREMDSMNRTP